MDLRIHDTADYSVIKFTADTPVPKEFLHINDFKSITYTAQECSLVVPSGTIDTRQAMAVDEGWMIIQVLGELDFSLVGILTQLATPLAENEVSIFALSTYNTDYLLIKNKDKEKAVDVLQQAGHVFA